MKNVTQLLILIIILANSSNAHAKILRVAFSGPQVAGVDYANVNTAVQAAAIGDTIQLYQNAAVGSSNIISKRLVFLGFGYSLNVNTGLQVVPLAANAAELHFRAGSENSIVQGVYGTFYIGTNNITISRCGGDVYLAYNTSIGPVPISSITVISSYIGNLYGQYGNVSNALISNSIISQPYLPNVAGLFNNNISTSSSNLFGSCVIKNNIFTSGCPSGNNAVFQNNLFSTGTCSITGSGNQFSVNMANVFLNWNGGNFGSETNLALKAGSPALNFGIDGNGNPTDAGIYGGEAGFVYKLSGIPAIPAIYQLAAPQLNANTNPYTITISVRSNN